MIEDLQDAIAAKGPIGEDDLRNNYNQYIAGSRTHKNNSSGKHKQSQLNTNTNSLTNQTMYIFKSQGSTERVNSSTNSKNPEGKFKKDYLKQKQPNRDLVNRTAMNTKSDANSISIGFGKSPDRSKNVSVYS